MAKHSPTPWTSEDLTEGAKLCIYIYDASNELIATVEGEREHDGTRYIDTDENEQQRANVTFLLARINGSVQHG